MGEGLFSRSDYESGQGEWGFSEYTRPKTRLRSLAKALFFSLAFHAVLTLILAFIVAGILPGEAPKKTIVIGLKTLSEGEKETESSEPENKKNVPSLEVPYELNLEPGESFELETQLLSPLGQTDRNPIIGVGGSDGPFFPVPGRGGDGGSGLVSFFGSTATAQKVVYILDKSGSMGKEGRLKAVVRELSHSIRELSPYAWFDVIFFDRGRTVPFSPFLVRACPISKRKCLSFVSGVEAGGGTDPLPALKIAYSLEPDLIFLLSDGLFDIEAVKFVRSKSRGRRIPIFTIGFRLKGGEELLKKIAHYSGGVYRSVW